MHKNHRGAVNRAFIMEVGLVTPAGPVTRLALEALRGGTRHIGPTDLFDVDPDSALPVAQAQFRPGQDQRITRTHRMALSAAEQALRLPSGIVRPDAVVLGATTGGVPTSEVLIRDGVSDPAEYRYHGTGTVAEYVAREVGCPGPALTVSTACSSGAVALAVALELIRRGSARIVLAGGVDALCRLTYHGFNMLRLIDPEGTRPFDAGRAGMTVGEGAAMLTLFGADHVPQGAMAELLGAALTCDAYHPSAPHPEGRGAYEVMVRALDDAGVELGDIEHINLHGTGTVGNDASEARAVVRLFGDRLPTHSSIKGTFGHAVGAAGALSAAAAGLGISQGFVPGNIGCRRPDPELGLRPIPAPQERPVGLVLANAFGFGGNNAALVLGEPRAERPGRPHRGSLGFEVLGESCLTGAGDLPATLAALERGERVATLLDEAAFTSDLPKGKLRRLKRLTKLALALVQGAAARRGELQLDAVFCGTCFGAVSELHDFLSRLYETKERFSSPTDFVGTVHNATAGHIATWYGARGPNVTTTAGDTSFEEALVLASLLSSPEREEALLLCGLDQHHDVLSPRLDPSHDPAAPTDGGGALLLRPEGRGGGGPVIRPVYLGPYADRPRVAEPVAELGGPDRIAGRYAAVWAGFPAAQAEPAAAQIAALAQIDLPVWDYRAALGQHPSVSAAAAALAAGVVRRGEIPAGMAGGEPIELGDRGILLLGLGTRIAAVEIVPS